jgi:hypothetical protein
MTRLHHNESDVCTDDMAITALFSQKMLLIRYFEAYLTSLGAWKIPSRLKQHRAARY